MSTALPAMAALPLLGWSVHAATLRHRLSQARRDPLTTLPTRDHYTRRAARLLRRRPALVVLVDLDAFKPLNDTHGHAAGDTALQAIAARLTAWAQRRGGIAARLGGDEFAAILPTPADNERELAALHWALTEPIAYADERLRVGASIGAHTAPAGSNLAGALGAADAAMYHAKRHREGWYLTHPADRPAPAPGRWKRARPATTR